MKSSRASNIEVKRINRNRTFRYVNSFERISKPEIAQSLGLSLPTVQQNVRELIALGLVRESGTFESTGGRKASAISAVKGSRMAVGVDITRHHLGIVLTDLSGTTLIHERVKRNFENSRAYYADLVRWMTRFREKNTAASRFLGFGISLPGIIDRENTAVLYSHALGLNNLPCSVIAEGLEDPVFFINDANAAGFAEKYHDPHPRNGVYLFLSQSVGGALLQSYREILSRDPLGDVIFGGDNNRSGEFGHMTLYPEGMKCYCGKTGCVDSYCSSRVLTSDGGDDLKSFFTRLEGGDRESASVWSRYLRDLSIVVNNLRMFYDAEVIIGGEVGRYIGPWMEELRELAADRNTFERDASYLSACRHRVESSALGAALVQVERFMSNV